MAPPLTTRQLILQQQAKSAVQSVAKSQRELYVGNVNNVSPDALRLVLESALRAAFPEVGGVMLHFAQWCICIVGTDCCPHI